MKSTRLKNGRVGGLLHTLLFLLLVSATQAAQAADCLLEATEGDIERCLQQSLREADELLNRNYSELLAIVAGSTREAMRSEQLRWLKHRNEVCGIAPSVAQAPDWIDKLSRQSAAAQCAQTMTFSRAGALKQHTEAERRRGDKALSDFPLVSDTWQGRYHGNAEIPVGKFQAYYINANQPVIALSKPIVDAVAIKYAFAELLNIKSEDFAGYWIGYVEVPDAGVMNLNISQGWSEAKVFLNKHQVYSGKDKARVPLRLEAGKYLMEVQYFNHWHTTEFSASLTPERKPLSPLQLADALKAQREAGVGVQFVGVYESGRRDTSLPLDLNFRSPQVLFLSSYEAVRWRLNASDAVRQVKAVIISSYSPGSDLQLPENFTVPLYYLDRQYGNYPAPPDCRCTGKNWHCEGSSNAQTIKQIEDMTKLTVQGLAGAYSPGNVKVPTITVDKDAISGFAEYDRQLEQQRKRCTGDSWTR